MMRNFLTMAAYGAALGAVVSIGISITVKINQPPPPAVEISAEEIGREVVRQHAAQYDEMKRNAEDRKALMRCGLPGYERCR